MTRTVAPGPRTGAVQIPASKSQAHRMLICAALSRTPGHLMLDGFSEDIEAVSYTHLTLPTTERV